MGSERLELIFGYDDFGDIQALDLVLLCTKKTGRESRYFRSYEENIDRRRLEEKIREERRFPTELLMDDLELRYGGSRSSDHNFLAVVEQAGNAEIWEPWVESATKYKGFVLAWVTDEDFNFWQNAHDPLQYTARGRDYSHLPLVSNGLPPPVHQMNIDTSKNPGRRVLRDGYVEGVGRTMWLSASFWKLTGREIDEKALIEAGWKVSISDGVLRLDVPKIVFTEQGDRVMQERLRFALYGN